MNEYEKIVDNEIKELETARNEMIELYTKSLNKHDIDHDLHGDKILLKHELYFKRIMEFGFMLHELYRVQDRFELAKQFDLTQQKESE